MCKCVGIEKDRERDSPPYELLEPVVRICSSK